MASDLVMKVKYGNTYKRFIVGVDETNGMDLNMVGLRAKIRSVFKFTADANFSLRYVDEEGDLVNLVDDDDLRDVMRQQLKFLRIEVNGDGFFPLEFSLWRSKISESAWKLILKEEVLDFGSAFLGGLCSAILVIIFSKPKVESILPAQPVQVESSQPVQVESAQPVQVESFLTAAPVRKGWFR